MSRTLKFRAWHFKLKRMFSAEEMAQDQMALLPTGCFANISSTDVRLSQIYSHEIMLPLQFTGLLDVKGKEIYEGDILKGTSYLYGYQLEDGKQFDYEGVVEWQQQADVGLCWIVRHKDGCAWNLNQCVHRNDIDRSTGKIAGNVHENPELLMGGTK